MAERVDIHGNLPALRAVLAEIDAERPDAIVVGGDVALGPLPAEAIDAVAALGNRARYVRGNCDRQMVEAYDSGGTGDAVLDWLSERLDSDRRDFLASFEPTVELMVDGLGAVLFCHGTPRSDDEIVTSLTPEERLAEILAGVEERTIVGGHTHVQYDRRAADKRLVNAGSVGMAYQGVPGAFWAVLGPDVQLRHTPLDPASVHAELARAGYPDLDDMLKESLLEPADPREVERYWEERAV
jgi:predicted phosphodiesterase